MHAYIHACTSYTQIGYTNAHTDTQIDTPCLCSKSVHDLAVFVCPQRSSRCADTMAKFEDHQDIMEATLSRYRLPQNVSMATVEEGHLRLMFLGIAACGKSSTGNTILGNITFETGNCPEPVTTHVCEASQLVHGCHVTAIDTPPRWTPPKVS